MSSLRGADILARSLRNAGVTRVFSLSGNHIMPLFDAAIDAQLDIVHVRHEGAATHMADAWGRLTGQPGVCFFTGGPGHANAVGPLFTALGGESPVVMISGHAPLTLIGMDAFQELRQADMAAPACKASWTAQRADGLGRDVARAMQLARAGRPGPVHLSLPTDVMEAVVQGGEACLAAAAACQPSEVALAPDLADTVMRALAAARRPLILTGPMLGNGPGRQARAALQADSGIPVLYMESPRGVADPSLGAVAEVLAQADTVLMLGKKLDFTVRFGNSPVFGKDCRFIQIDPDSEALRRAALASEDRARIQMAMLADTLPAARALTEAARRRGLRAGAWSQQVQTALSFRPEAWSEVRSHEGAVHALDIGRALQGIVARTPDVIYVSDGGEASQWSQACVGERANLRMTNGPGGAIGGGVAFAIAAKLAHPSHTVLLTIGDGSFGYHIMEFETALRCNAPFVAIVANDGAWNAEYQIQLRTYGRERALGCEMSQTRYDLMVAAMGGHGELVVQAEELPAAIERAIASGKPACVNVMAQRAGAPTFTRLAGSPTTSGAA